MPAYTFENLSSYDLECLVRDLLHAELALPLESFASGRDSGIDLRHSRDSTRSLVIQCKHFVASGFKKLLAHLKESERPKVNRLKPTRYVLATSVRLTPGNKDALVQLFQPFIHTPQDIFGADDLNALLAKYPHIEQAHYKLYLTSTSVLQRVLHGEVLSRTSGVLEAAHLKARVYVQSASFPQAKHILDTRRACVIAGVPGIGKTTLAEMLVLAYARQGYEPILISADISEADRVFDSQRPQIFYYDDFLGQTSLAEKLQKNEDDRLIRFIARIEANTNKRFVLTTREYVLQQAQMHYEKLHRARALKLGKYVLELSAYTRLDRARILYNHLSFSRVPREWKLALMENKAYLRLIDHPNYNPRLIENIVELAEGRVKTPSEFLAYIFKTFDDPRDLWSHPFERQLSDPARALLLALVTLPSEVSLDDTRRAADAYLGASTKDLEFYNALRVLDDTFINIDQAQDIKTLRFHNPSIRDFLLNHLDETPEVVTQLLRTTLFYSQSRLLWRYAHATTKPNPKSTPVPQHAGIRKTLDRHAGLFLESIRKAYRTNDCTYIHRSNGKAYTVHSHATSLEARLLLYVKARQGFETTVDKDWLKDAIAAMPARWNKIEDAENVLELLMELEKLDLWTQAERIELLDAGKHLLFRAIFDTDYIQQLMSFRSSFPETWSAEDDVELREAFHSWVDMEFDAIHHDIEDAAEAAQALEDVESLAKALSLQLNEQTLMGMRLNIHEKWSRFSQNPSQQPVQDSKGIEDEQSAAQIDAMFSALRDEQQTEDQGLKG